MVKKIVKSLMPRPALELLQRARKQIRNFYNLSRNYGQWVTIRDWNSVDEKRNPIPWYTYPTIEYLSHLNLSNMTVFEYGSGNSTLWWTKKSKSVVSVEDDLEWFKKISQNLDLIQTKYLFKPGKAEYVAASCKDADIFVIDGNHRRECAEHVVRWGGGVMVIFDNADWFPETVDFLRSSLCWLQIDFHGFGPINGYTWTTSVFINPNRHQELNYKSNLESKCGLIQVADGDY